MAKKLVRKFKSCRNIRNIYENIWPTKKCSIKQQSKFQMASKPILIKIQFHAVCLHYHFKKGLLVPKHENTRSNITSMSLAISVRPYKWSRSDPPMLCKATPFASLGGSSHGFYDNPLMILAHRFYNGACTLVCKHQGTPTTLSSRYARLPAPLRVTTPILRRAHSLKPRGEAALSFDFFWNLLLHIGFVNPTIVSKNGTSGWALMGCSLHGSTFCLRGHRRPSPPTFCSTATRRNGIGGQLCCSEASDHCDFQTTTLESAPPKRGPSARPRRRYPPYGFACQASEKPFSRTSPFYQFYQCTSMAKRIIVLFGMAPLRGASPAMSHLCDGIGSLCGYFVNNMTPQFFMTKFILRQRHSIFRVPFRCLSVNALALRASSMKSSLMTVDLPHLFCAYSAPLAHLWCQRERFKALEPFAQMNNPLHTPGRRAGRPKVQAPTGASLGSHPYTKCAQRTQLGATHRYRCKHPTPWCLHTSVQAPFGGPLRCGGCEAFGRATSARDRYSGYVTHAFEGIVNLREAPGCCSAGSQLSSGTPEGCLHTGVQAPGGRQNQCSIPKSKKRFFQSAAQSDPVPTVPPLREGTLLPLYVLRRALYHTRNPKSATQLKSLFRFQLQETKKLSLLYGNLSRKQIQKICNQAFTHPLSPDALTESVFVLLERRLDVVLFRAGFCKSIFQARQWIHHNKMNVNGRAQSAPGYLCSPGDIISCTHNSFHNVCKHLEHFYITRRSRLADRGSSRHAGGLQWLRSLGDTEPHTLPFSIRTLRMRSFAIPPLNLEVNYRNLTAVYLYSPQRIILPTFVDIYLVIRGLYR